MTPQIKETGDGSPTLFSERFQQHYHSIFGARQESDRVFMELGWDAAKRKTNPIRLFEFGFGTGLNALLTWQQADAEGYEVFYTGLEAYPVALEVAQQIHYGDQPRMALLHKSSWEIWHSGSPQFHFRKIAQRWEDFSATELYDLIYFDAFPPVSQPELWTTEVFAKIASLMAPGAILTTYCAKGVVQRSLKEVGLIVEKHKGPMRKREVIRAIKP